MPALVGHSLTYVGDNKLVLIGGFSSQIYFSNKVYEYDAESVLLNWQEFSPQKMNGAYPIGKDACLVGCVEVFCFVMCSRRVECLPVIYYEEFFVETLC